MAGVEVHYDTVTSELKAWIASVLTVIPKVTINTTVQEPIVIVTNNANTARIDFSNTNSGIAARAGFIARADVAVLAFDQLSSNNTQAPLTGVAGANATWLESVSSSAFIFSTPGGTAPIIFGIGVTERFRITNSGLASFGGITASFPALKPNGATLEVKLADNSAYAILVANRLQAVGPSGTGLAEIGEWVGSGGYNAIYLNGAFATTSSYNFLSSKTGDNTLYINRPSGANILFRENNVTQFSLDTGGGATFINNIAIGNNNVRLGAAVDGVLLLQDSTASSFNRIQFGGTSNSFPALKKETILGAPGLSVRLADDSGYGHFFANNIQIANTGGIYTVSNGALTNIASAQWAIGNNLGTLTSLWGYDRLCLSHQSTLNAIIGNGAQTFFIGDEAVTKGFNLQGTIADSVTFLNIASNKGFGFLLTTDAVAILQTRAQNGTYATLDCLGLKASGAAGFNGTVTPVTSITVVNGIVTNVA